MNKLSVAFAAVIVAAVVPAHSAPQTPLNRATPTPSIAFSSLTSIYFASGVLDSGHPANEGNATVVHCSNISGVSTQLRLLFFSPTGVILGNHVVTLLNVHTYTASTHGVNVFGDTAVNTGPIVQGLLAVQTTQSAVFCTAMVVDAAAAVPNGIDLHMVRFNEHPGVVE